MSLDNFTKDIFVRNLEPELIKWSEKISKEISFSLRNCEFENRKFGGEESYGAVVYEFFKKTTNTIGNYF